MAQWVGAFGRHISSLAAHILSRIREGGRIFAGDTTSPISSPGPGKTKSA
jgi:hypothetical protein